MYLSRFRWIAHRQYLQTYHQKGEPQNSRAWELIGHIATYIEAGQQF